MREIKFRGTRVAKGCMIYGNLMNGQGKSYIYPIGSHSAYEVKPETIGQYTGLRDKYGKEIYEGDILLVKEYKNDAIYFKFNYEEIKEELSLEEIRGELQCSYKAFIYYEEGCFVVSPINIKSCEMYISAMFGDMKYSQPIFEFEVIGNIHDNPELIKEEK